MQQDRNGWHLAPAGEFWCCPDCDGKSAIEEWSRCTIIDHDEREEDARLCPACGSIISGAGSIMIAKKMQAAA